MHKAQPRATHHSNGKRKWTAILVNDIEIYSSKDGDVGSLGLDFDVGRVPCCSDSDRYALIWVSVVELGMKSESSFAKKKQIKTSS